MAYTVLEDDAIHQVALSVSAFDRHALAMDQGKRFAAVMDWREWQGDMHLFKTDVNGRQHRFGPRSEELVRLHDTYLLNQRAAHQDLAACSDQIRVCESLNRTTGANRVPGIVIGILNALHRHGLGDFYRVIGTHALYAYESAAGVTFDPESTATNDVDLLWDVQQRIRLVRELKEAGLSMVQLLQGVDPTFERDGEQTESAMNAAGFAVDFLRRLEPTGGPAFSISDVEGDVYPVQARNAQQFLSSPHFEQVVIGVDGSMARMRTVDPQVFVDFKRWMCNQPERDFIKRGRDRLQADAVQQLLDEGRLLSAV